MKNREIPIDPDLIESGVKMLRAGKTKVLYRRGERSRVFTEEVPDELAAAYYALLRAGVGPEEAATTYLNLKTRLAAAIGRQAAKQKPKS